MPDAYLALGSNLGDRREQLRRALAALAERGVSVRRVSSLYETEPMYVADQPAFLNAAILVDTWLTPEELLRAAKDVELALGRQPRQRFGPRELDVDLLLYGDERRATPELTLPHPRMQERPFVQAPLAELRGDPPAVYPGVRVIEDPEWARD